MTVRQAREAARDWVRDEGSHLPGFRGAYTAGSTNWLSEDAKLPATSDLDLMVVLAGGTPVRRKFGYQGILLEVSCLDEVQLGSPEQVLSDYHLAPSLRTATILDDPLGHLTPLREAVSRGYADPEWIRRRYTHARDKVLAHLSLHDDVGCLFGAGITTHVLLVAGLRNPTVRTRYVSVRELLSEFGRLDFHETLLELLGAARLPSDRANRHLDTLATAFEAAQGRGAGLPFATDLTASARPMAIDGSRELIGRGLHREAMFWIAVSHWRCRSVPGCVGDSYRDLLHDLGMGTPAGIRLRVQQIQGALPRVCALAEEIVTAYSKR